MFLGLRGEHHLSPLHTADFLSFKDKDFCIWSFKDIFKDKNLLFAVPKDEDFCLSQKVFEIKHVESRSPSLKDKTLLLRVPHTVDFYVLEIPNTKIFFFERQNSTVCAGLYGQNFYFCM